MPHAHTSAVSVIFYRYMIQNKQFHVGTRDIIQCDVTIICISKTLSSILTKLQKFYKRGYIVNMQMYSRKYLTNYRYSTTHHDSFQLDSHNLL